MLSEDGNDPPPLVCLAEPYLLALAGFEVE
jgi:hypothetical protein